MNLGKKQANRQSVSGVLCCTLVLGHVARAIIDVDMAFGRLAGVRLHAFPGGELDSTGQFEV